MYISPPRGTKHWLACCGSLTGMSGRVNSLFTHYSLLPVLLGRQRSTMALESRLYHAHSNSRYRESEQRIKYLIPLIHSSAFTEWTTIHLVILLHMSRYSIIALYLLDIAKKSESGALYPYLFYYADAFGGVRFELEKHKKTHPLLNPLDWERRLNTAKEAFEGRESSTDKSQSRVCRALRVIRISLYLHCVVNWTNWTNAPKNEV